MTICEIIESATGLECYPFFVDDLDEYVVYTVEPYTDDGIKATDRLTVRVISSDIPNGLLISNRIKQAFITIGDNSKENNLQCVLNGGGSLRDNDTKKIHTIMYFYITRKSEVKL